MRTVDQQTLGSPALSELQIRAAEAAGAAIKRWQQGGLSRRMVLGVIGSLAALWVQGFNRSRVVNREGLLRAVRERPAGVPLISCSNHMSTLDDPLMWGARGLPRFNPANTRWVLTAEDICFTNPVYAYFFRLGQCIPIRRGAGVHHEYVLEVLARINRGEWVHTFPEGKIQQELGPLPRLKWGIGSLIARASTPPIVLPVCHSGFQQMLPQKTTFLGIQSGRPKLPLVGKNVTIVVGDLLEFDVPALKKEAESAVARAKAEGKAFPWEAAVGEAESASVTRPGEGQRGIEESITPRASNKATASTAQATLPLMPEDNATKWLYAEISERIRVKMEELAFEAHRLNAMGRRWFMSK
ncbi:lysoglycerophospholipid O-acyltransferase [Klebsormidium nitens]|uniref:Tafazzin family protein n=1 Tax=Klebsormidium nitens TaxID=105231 RepID=A0A0U9HPJ0_KLENI|nr:lysoglycerophospholipid O-acyltransferase [Klebsormidium nitens]|eukprot:GAQ89888.1 lysoglycerophospholipid O-acyltransferase [Klebsormidium nitens]